MDDSVVDQSPRVAPEPPVTAAGSLQRVVVGTLDERRTYRTVRPSGTTDWLLLVTTAGCGFLRRTDGEQLRLRPGLAALVEPRTGHDYGTDQSPGRWVFNWAHLEPRPEWVPLLDWP